MLAVLLALAAAAGYGGSDYTAGLAARQASVVRVTVLVEVTSAALLLCVIPFISSQGPTLTSVLWGAGAGASGVAGAMATADPQAETELSLKCVECGLEWQEPFDIESFFWMEVQAWAMRTLREVHQLAAAYGWGEKEILKMHPRRRSLYLSLMEE